RRTAPSPQASSRYASRRSAGRSSAARNTAFILSAMRNSSVVSSGSATAKLDSSHTRSRCCCPVTGPMHRRTTRPDGTERPGTCIRPAATRPPAAGPAKVGPPSRNPTLLLHSSLRLPQQRRHVGPELGERLLLLGRQLVQGAPVADAGEVGVLLPV